MTKPVPEKVAEAAEASDAAKVEEQIEITMAPHPGVRARLISSVLIGDFLHNLCDGFFLGAVLVDRLFARLHVFLFQIFRNLNFPLPLGADIKPARIEVVLC